VPNRIPQFLFTGLAVIALAWLLHDWLGLLAESVVTLGGSALLVAGHWLNYRHHIESATKKPNLNY